MKRGEERLAGHGADWKGVGDVPIRSPDDVGAIRR
jgi:hypothetical protein